MAVPIRFQPSRREPVEELRSSLNTAPREHAEALLEAYDILQALHDRGVLAALRGALNASDFILENVVETIKTPQAIRAIRNLIVLSKVLGSIEPGLLDEFIRTLPEGLGQASAKKSQTPGLFSLFQRFTSKDSRRGMAAAAEIPENFGKGLGSG